MVLLIPLLSLSVALFIFFKNYHRSYYFCYKTGVRMQQELKQKLKQLMGLNRTAQKLRASERRAKTLLRTALLSTKAIAIRLAWKNLIRIRFKQKNLKFIQDRILKQASHVVPKHFSILKSRTSSWMWNLKKQHFRNGLAVQAYPPLSRSPSYKLVSPFSFQQQIVIQWAMDPFLGLSSVWRKKWSLSKKNLHQCAVSLKKRHSQFHIQMMKGDERG